MDPSGGAFEVNDNKVGEGFILSFDSLESTIGSTLMLSNLNLDNLDLTELAVKESCRNPQN